MAEIVNKSLFNVAKGATITFYGLPEYSGKRTNEITDLDVWYVRPNLFESFYAWTVLK